MTRRKSPTRQRRSDRRPDGDEAAPESWRTRAVLPLLIVCAGLVVYANSLTGPFVFDDHLTLIDNESIRQVSHLRSALSPERELPTAGRPLVNLTFALTYAVAGLDVPLYHAGNIAIHIACALLLFGIVRRTLSLVAPSVAPAFRGRSAPALAGAIAALWVMHPLNTEAVDYITQRTEVMMALFYLLTLYAAIRAAEPHARAAWQVGSVVSCALGMACKESMVTAPIVVALYDRIFLFGSLGAAWRARWRLYVGLALSWLVLMALLSSGPRLHSAGFSTGVTPWTYLLNQTIVIARYLWLTIWPHALVLSYGAPVPLTIGQVLPFALLILFLLLLTVVALVRWPRWGFLAAFAFIALAPTSSIVPIATEVGAERRMYLPLAALLTLAVLAAVAAGHALDGWIARRASGRTVQALRTTGILAAAALYLALAMGTVIRNREYGSALLLAQTTVDRYPTSIGHHMLGEELSVAGHHDEAVKELRLALPGAPRAYYALGLALFRQGKLDEAIQELTAFVRAEPLLIEAVSARQMLGQALASQRRWTEAVEQFQQVLAMHPTPEQRTSAQGLLAEAWFRQQAFGDAVTSYRAYLQSQPQDVGALTNFAIALTAIERPDEALMAFRRAVEVDPRNGASQRNLAQALLDKGIVEEAVAAARRAVELRPADPAAFDVLGHALASQHKAADAAAAFERALQIDPTDADARETLQGRRPR